MSLQTGLYVPTEILTEICGHIHSSSTLDNYHIVLNASSGNSRTTYPWNLMLVCKHWHEVIVSLPRLWTNFHLKATPLPSWVLDTVLESNRPPVYPSLALCLSRSRNLPLRFRITGSEIWLNYPSLFLSQLLIHANRWEAVDLDFTVDDVGHNHNGGIELLIRTRPRVTFPRLQELKIKTAAGSDLNTSNNWQLLISRIFKNAPILSKLHSNFCDNFPVSNITHFSTTIDPTHYATTYGSVLFAICRMPALTCLSITVKKSNSKNSGYYPTPLEGFSKPIPLRSLNLFIISPPERMNDLTSLFVDFPPSPALTHLKISQGSSIGHFLDSLKYFLRASQCTIKSLDVDRMTSGPLLSLIRILRRLESINLDSVHFSNPLFKALTFPLERRTAKLYGRRIKEMEIAYPVLRGQGQVDSFVKMLESRLNWLDDERTRCGLMYLNVVLPMVEENVLLRDEGLFKSLDRLRSLYREKMYISNN